MFAGKGLTVVASVLDGAYAERAVEAEQAKQVSNLMLPSLYSQSSNYINLQIYSNRSCPSAPALTTGFLM